MGGLGTDSFSAPFIYKGLYMAGNTRGKIKEHLEGVHRNNEWIQKHISECISLIGNKNPSLVIGLKSLAEGYNKLDELTQGIYAHI